MRRSLFCGVCAGAIVLGCAGGTGPLLSGEDPYVTSLTHMNKIRVGILSYTGDFDDVLPPAGKWVDATLAYTGNEVYYHSPAAPSAFGYALNSSFAGKSISSIESASTTPLLFDSTVLVRNATALPDTMPTPGRYRGRNTILFADGTLQDANLLSDGGGGGTTLFQLSQSRLRQVANGSHFYATDNDDRLPLAGRWVDETLPYVQKNEMYRSPIFDTSNPSAYGFALNVALAGQSTVEMVGPANQIMLFDSTDTSRNATQPTTTLPSPPRYTEGNTVAYADGHVAALLPGTAKRVR